MLGRVAVRFATAVNRPLVAYTAATLCVGVGVALRQGLSLVLANPGVIAPFFPAVLLAAAIGGLGPGLYAIVLGAAIAVTFWMGGVAHISEQNISNLIIFSVIAALMVLMVQGMRVAVRRGFQAEERFRSAQDSALDAFVILDPVTRRGEIVDFRWSYANPAAEAMRPAGVSTLVGRRVLEMFPDEAGAGMVARLKAVLAGDRPDDVELDWKSRGADWRLRSSAMRLGDGVAATFRDVTGERAAAEAVSRSEAQFRALAEMTPQLIWSTDARGLVDYFSPQWSAYTGVPEQEHFGAGWLEALHSDDRARAAEAWRLAVEEDRGYDVEYRLRRHDGALRWFKVRGQPIRDEAGAIQRWFGVCTDISELVEARRDLEARFEARSRELEQSLEDRARTEAALAQAQRLETVGRLTGGVAHDFNNLLTVVIGGLDMILRKPSDTARVVRYSQAALEAGRRGERLTRQLLAFARSQELKLQTIDLSGLLRSSEPLLRRAVDEAVELKVIAPVDVGGARVDAAQFESAVLNLVVNAADATPSGGAITLEVARQVLAEGEVAGATAGDHLCVSVTDTGAGMPPHVLTRVFEPFFTTKEIGKGTGLGLAQVYGFVRQCGGAVTVDSAVGEGTRVALYLPRADVSEAEATPDAAPVDFSSLAGRRVLLVEDDAAVREVGEAALLEFGCQVTTAVDGREAVARLRAGERFEMLISDIVMPGGVSGVDVANTGRELDAGLAILLTTGYAGERVDGAPADLPWAILHKPFRTEELAAAMVDALKGEPAAA
ncbi:MAG: PAS domain S-box protein [Caulobacterales bacterium]|nr:PAS domain S-box protein [Caulobacterales bacterium]